jgi:asparagine synthase (glutamine-hydrolysing)
MTTPASSSLEATRPLCHAGLQSVFRAARLSIFANDEVVLLPGNRGAIVGQLFTRTMAPRRVTQFDEDVTKQILATRGQFLLSNYWGGYVALLLADEDVIVIRDPSGALPCYYTQTGTGLAISSDVEGLVSATGQVPGVDWNGLFLHLAGIEFKRPHTALNGIAELLAGYRLNMRNPEATEPIWSPWDYIRPTRQTDREAAERLKAIVDSSVDAWGSCFPKAGVSLSGGLDSSIVVAALRNRAESLALVNLASNDAEGDERQYARLAAEAVRIPLNEVFYDPEDVDFTRSTSSYLPRPIYSALAMADIAVKLRIGVEHSLDAWMSGLGGDNVFCIMNSPVALLDRQSVEGVTPRIFQTFRDVLRLTGRSIPEILREAWRYRQRYRGRFDWAAETEFLSQKRLATERVGFDHPWLSPPAGTPIGKVEHVASLLRIQGSIDGFERSGPPLINPLLSQPIIEACLSIPTWQWCAAGRNRSVARQAYSEVLPMQLLNRRSKGGPNAFAFRLMNANRAILKALLVDGLLVEKGILEREAVAGAFKGDMPLSANNCFHLSFLAEAETWCRYWEGRASPGRIRSV